MSALEPLSAIGGGRATVGAAGSLGIVDRAAHLVRGEAGVLARTILPASGGLAFVAILAYYAERVLAISSLRPFFAAAAAALVALRAVAAGTVARHVAELALHGESDLPSVRGAIRARRADLARAGVVAALLDVPAIFLVAWMSALGPLGAVLLLPVAGLRWIGASPTWTARVALTDDGVARAWWRAWRDGAGARGKAFFVETLLWIVMLLVFVNGYVVLLFGAGIAGTLFGLDLAFAASFLSPSNGFALTVLVVASLLLVEPLRMVASGLLFIDARVRHDALDLRRRIDAITERRAARGRAAMAAAVLLAAGAWLQPLGADAQDAPIAALPGIVDVAPLPEAPPSAGAAARDEAARLLAAPEFAPVPQPGSGHFDDWLREVIRDLFDLLMPDPDAIPDLGLDFGLPGVRTFLAIGALVLLGAIGFTIWALRASRSQGGPAEANETARAVDVRERDPVDILAEAEELRARGELRAALRTVYLATLVQLDRRRDIVFDPSRTNWQYLRDFPAGERRDAFASLTRLFDHKWYGHEPVSDEDVRGADRVARAILSSGAPVVVLEESGGSPRA